MVSVCVQLFVPGWCLHEKATVKWYQYVFSCLFQAGAYMKRLLLTGISMCSAVCFRLVLT